MAGNGTMYNDFLRGLFRKLFTPSSIAIVSDQKISRLWIFHDGEVAHPSAPISFVQANFSEILVEIE